MKCTILGAIAALVLTSAAAAQTRAPDLGVLAPAPGKAVEVNGMKCLMTNLYDRVVWCSGYGKVDVPACAYPAVNDGKLVCENRIAIQRQ